MRQPRVHLRTMMTAVAFFALTLALVIQSSRLQQSLAREQSYLAGERRAKAWAEARLLQTRADDEQFAAALAEFNSKFTVQQSQPTATLHYP